MVQKFIIDGLDYNAAAFSEEAKALVSRLSYIQIRLNEINNNLALLAKAKNGYIEDMKTEIIQERTGVDFSDLFSDE